jgi:hypothetical protein
MASPTPTKRLHKNGRAFVQTYHAVWANTDDIDKDDTAAKQIVVDVSALPYTNRIRIYQIHITTTAGISALLVFDDASGDDITGGAGTFNDALIYRHPVGVVGNIVLDFTHIDGLTWNDLTASSTGDILLTTTSAASGDEVSIVVVGRCS